MNLIADILLAGGAFGVAVYCFVLSRRLTRFTDLERGVGGAVAVLSAQVDELTRALESARKAADGSGETLRELTERAENVSRRLELHVASLHDLEPAGPAAEASASHPDEPPASRRAPQHDAPESPPAFRSTTSRAKAEAPTEIPAETRAEARAEAPISFRSASVTPTPAPLAEDAPEKTPLAAPARVPSYFSSRRAGAAK